MEQKYSNPLPHLGRVNASTPCNYCVWACTNCAKEHDFMQV